MSQTGLTDVEDRFRTTRDWEGRTYQQYSLTHEVNLAPVDDDEANRLESQHVLVKEIFSERWPPHRLYPDFVGEPVDLLDCGFGTASWVAEAAEYDPDCNVTGVDIVLQMAADYGENVLLEVADLNEKLDFEGESFDLANSRFVAGGLARHRWPGYLADLFRVLRKGGWVQIMEWDLHFRSNNDHDEALGALQDWTRMYHAALDASVALSGRKLTRISQIEDLVRAARFESVRCEVLEIPTCAWSTDTHLQSVGEQNLANMRALIGAIAQYPVVNRGICSKEMFDEIVRLAKDELALQDAQPYLRLYACWARKPA